MVRIVIHTTENLLKTVRDYPENNLSHSFHNLSRDVPGCYLKTYETFTSANHIWADPD